MIGAAAFEQAERAEAHAKLMAKENNELRRQLHAPKPAKTRKLNMQARFLTREEGPRLRNEAAAKEAKEAEIAAEKARQAREVDEERQRRREKEAPVTIWGGGWRN